MYKAEFTEPKDKTLTETIKNEEGKDYLKYEWIDLNKIEEYLLKPQAIKDILKKKEFPVHTINKD